MRWETKICANQRERRTTKKDSSLMPVIHNWIWMWQYRIGTSINCTFCDRKKIFANICYDVIVNTARCESESFTLCHQLFEQNFQWVRIDTNTSADSCQLIALFTALRLPLLAGIRFLVPIPNSRHVTNALDILN